MDEKSLRRRLHEAEKEMALVRRKVDDQLQVVHRLEALGKDDSAAQRRLEALLEQLEATQQKLKALR